MRHKISAGTWERWEDVYDRGGDRCCRIWCFVLFGVEDAITDQGVIVSQGENAKQSRMAGGGAGQHTTGATEPPGGMSSGDLSTWTRARKPDRARYRPGQGLTKVKGRTSTPGTPAAAANHPTSESVGSKRSSPDSP